MDSQAICLELYSSEYGNSPLKVQPQGKQDFAPEFVDTWKASCLLISNNLTPQKPATVASKKCYFFMVLHHRNPSANSGAARLLRPWRRPCSANAEAGRCSGGDGLGVGSWKTLPKWWPFRLVKCKIVHLPLPPKIISWFHEEFASWSSENYWKIGADLPFSPFCLVIRQKWQLEISCKR